MTWHSHCILLLEFLHTLLFTEIIYWKEKAKAPPLEKARALLKPTDFNLINIPSYKILLRYVSQEHKTIKL